MPPVRVRVARECAVFLLFAAFAVAMTWPLALSMRTGVSDLGDPLLNTWIVDWTGKSLAHDPAGLYDSPMYYPARLSLAFSENLAGVALLVLPFQLAGFWPVTVYNIAMLLGFTLAGYGGYVLSRVVTGSTLASITGGIIFAFVPHKFDHLAHLQIISSGWLPLLLAAVLAYWKRPTRTRAALLTAAFVMNGLTNIHFLLFGGFAAAVTIVVLAIVDPRRGRRFWLPLVLALGVGGGALFPFLLPYRVVAEEYGMKRGKEEVAFYSGWPSDWLTASSRNVLYGSVGPGELHRPELQLWPGLAAIVLALAGALWWRRRDEDPPDSPPVRIKAAPEWLVRTLDVLIALAALISWLAVIDQRVRWRIGSFEVISLTHADAPFVLLIALTMVRLTLRYPAAFATSEAPSLYGVALRSRFPPGAWAAAVWIAVGFLGSLGMHSFFHGFLYRRVDVFQAIRAVGRWAIVTYPGLGVWASIGVVAIASRWSGKRRVFAAVACAAVVLFDLRARTRWEHTTPQFTPASQWLAVERIAPLVEIPFRGEGVEYQYDLQRTAHHLPSFNGTSGFEPPLHFRMNGAFLEGKYDEMFRLLEANGCRIMVIHRHVAMSQSPQFRAWLARTAGSGRIGALRSFDHELGGDFVYAVTRNLPGWKAYREAEVPDGAGHLPSERFARMLAGQTVYSNQILAYLDTVQWGATVRGPLDVRGWTLSPFAIRRVTLLLDRGSVRIDIPLTDPRPDLRQLFPWYPLVPKPGFGLKLDARPPGVPRQTDLRVEVEDAGGRIAHTPLFPIDWEPAE